MHVSDKKKERIAVYSKIMYDVITYKLRKEISCDTDKGKNFRDA